MSEVPNGCRAVSDPNRTRPATTTCKRPDGGLVVSARASHLHPWQVEAVRRMRLRHPDLVVVDHGATGGTDLLGDRAVIAHDTSAIAARAAAGLLLAG